MNGTEREMNLRTYKHHSSLTINIETTRSIVKNMSVTILAIAYKPSQISKAAHFYNI